MDVALANTGLLLELRHCRYIKIVLHSRGPLLSAELIILVTPVIGSFLATLYDIKTTGMPVPIRGGLLRLLVVEFWRELGDCIRLFTYACAALTVSCVPLCFENRCSFKRILDILLLFLYLSCEQVIDPRTRSFAILELFAATFR